MYLVSDPSLRTVPNLLVVDLAIGDMIFSLFCGFPIMGVACFRRKWTWSETGEYIRQHVDRRNVAP